MDLRRDLVLAAPPRGPAIARAAAGRSARDLLSAFTTTRDVLAGKSAYRVGHHRWLRTTELRAIFADAIVTPG